MEGEIQVAKQKEVIKQEFQITKVDIVDQILDFGSKEAKNGCKGGNNSCRTKV